MKTNYLVYFFAAFSLTAKCQQLEIKYNKAFTGEYVNRFFSVSEELTIFGTSWNNIVNTYLMTTSFSNRLSSLSSFDVPQTDPAALLNDYYQRIDAITKNFAMQLSTNAALIDQTVRGMGDLASDFAREQGLTTKSPVADLLIKEGLITAISEKAKQKNAEKLEAQKEMVEYNLELELSQKMGEIRDQMLADNLHERDRYLEAMIYEADLTKEKYYCSCYDYHNCFDYKVRQNYDYKSPLWYKPDCEEPGLNYSTGITNQSFVQIAERKYQLLIKYKNDRFKEGINLFLDAALSENKQNPEAYYLKSEMENDIINKLFYIRLASSLKPENDEYRNMMNAVDREFNDAFFLAIRNGDAGFMNRSIEKGFQLGRTKNGSSAIESVIDYDKAVLLTMLLSSYDGTDKMVPDNYASLMFYACAVNAVDVVKKLIELGVDPEYEDKELMGLTALNIAQKNNNERIVELLAKNYDIKPALLFEKKSGPGSLDDLSFSIYKVAPEKMGEIISVNPDFRTKYFVDFDIRTNQKDAEILINNKLVGNGSAKVKDSFVKDEYHLTVKKPGYSLEEKDVVAVPGKDTKVSVTLQKLPRPLSKYLVLSDIGYEPRTWEFFYKPPVDNSKKSHRKKQLAELEEQARSEANESARLYNEKINSELDRKNKQIKSENEKTENENKKNEQARMVKIEYIARGNISPSDNTISDPVISSAPHSEPISATRTVTSDSNSKNEKSTDKKKEPVTNVLPGLTIIEKPVAENKNIKTSAGKANTSATTQPTQNVPVTDENIYTGNYGIFIDARDQRKYSWVRMNNQLWMAENLAYIPEQPDDVWAYGIQSDADKAMENNDNYLKYGLLYTYDAATVSCPVGWRLPTDLEWSKLESYLDNSIIDLNQTSYRGTDIGSKLVKIQPESMKVKMGGKKMLTGEYLGAGLLGAFWTSTVSGQKAWFRQIQKDVPQTIRSLSEKSTGYSVRCIKLY